MTRSTPQMEFDFNTPRHPGPDGLELWRSETRHHQQEQARQLGLPLGQPVELELRCGTVLRGRLHLATPEWNHPPRQPAQPQLAIGLTKFQLAQVTRCVTLADPREESSAPA